MNIGIIGYELTGDTEAIKKALDENNKEHGWLGVGAEQVNKSYIKYEYPAHHLLVKFVLERIIEEINDLKPIPSTAIC